jgi:hypothetical protein
MRPKQPPGEPMTVGNMRQLGVRRLFVNLGRAGMSGLV